MADDGGGRARRLEILRDGLALQKAALRLSGAVAALRRDNDQNISLNEHEILIKARELLLDATEQFDVFTTRVLHTLGKDPDV